MANINEFTEAVLAMKDELTRMRKNATKADPIPFMQERVSNKATARARIQNMSPEERRAFVEKNGIDEVMRIIGNDTGRKS
jgi:hypothetical protein